MGTWPTALTSHLDLLAAAVDAVDLARALVRARIPGRVMSKGDRDMVSELDFAVEQALRSFLSDATAGIGFLGEEEGATGPDTGLRWVLDPIDGTANLVHGLPLCAVSLALVDGKHPVLGVIDLPFLGSRYHAVEGHGAYVDETPIQVSRTDALIDAVVSIGDYAVGEGAGQKNEVRLDLTGRLAGRVQRVRMFGSAAIDLAWVAHGLLDATIILSNKPWDMAAGVIIAREAGAGVTDQDGTPHNADSRATIAATPGILHDVLDLLQN